MHPTHMTASQRAGKEAQRRTGAKITATKIMDAKKTQHNFPDAKRDDTKG